MAEIFKENPDARVLYLFAHPDDDLAAQATISDSPKNAFLAFATLGENGVIRHDVDGEIEEEKIDPETLGKMRRQEGEASANRYGIAPERLKFFDGLTDSELADQEDALYERTIRQIGDWGITDVVVISKLDDNPDHIATMIAADRAVGILQAHAEDINLWGLDTSLFEKQSTGVCSADKDEHLLVYNSQFPTINTIRAITKREDAKGHHNYLGFFTAESLVQIDPLEQEQDRVLVAAGGAA